MASSSLQTSTLMLLVILFSVSSWCEGREYVVGGSENSWKLPQPSTDSLTKWASSHKFKIGDSLLFKYNNRTGSVHVVNETDYKMCNTQGKDHKVYKDGNTKVVLTKSGHYHFICGTNDHCQMGLKMSVLVSSKSKKQENKSESPSPSPSPSLPELSPSPSPSVAHSTSSSPMWLGITLLMIMFFD